MRALRKALRILFGIVGLVVLGVAARLVYLSIPRTDAFYVVSADFAEPKFFAKLQAELQNTDPAARRLARLESLTVFAHRIAMGSRTVIAYRWFTSGSPLVIDDELFEKITVAMPSIAGKQKFEGKIEPDGPVVAIVTRGGSAWPQAACSWRVDDGGISIEVNSSNYVIHLVGRLKVEPPSPTGTGHCADDVIDKRFEAKQLQLSDVTPWLGKEGEHLYAETYR